MSAPVFHVFTDEQLEELVERLALKIVHHGKPPAVKLKEAARLLAVSEDSLRRRIAAKLVAVLPGLGPVRISMREIERLNRDGFPTLRGA